MFLFKPEEKYKIKLQSPSKSIWSTFKKAFILQKDFKRYWLKLDKSNLPDDLIQATNVFVESPSYDWVSKFWKHLIIGDYNTLTNTSDKDGFKKAILDHYTSSTFFDKKNVYETCKKLEKEKIPKVDLFKKHLNMDSFDSLSYNLALLIMYVLSKNSIIKYYDKINKEFYLNYSPSLEIDNKIVNQHLILSILEYEKIKFLSSNFNDEQLRFLEIGAGYGRTANAIISLNKKTKYIIVDIPPSIYISKLNLKNNYPNLKISSAFNINSSSELEKTINQNDVIYIFPHQMKLLNQNSIDVTLAITSLLEMEKKIVKRYMEAVNFLSKSLYIKVFKNSGLPYSFYHFYRSNVRSDYFIKQDWKEKFNEPCIVPDFLIHMGYIIKKS